MANVYEFTGVSSSNYIKQITAESVNYDVALTNGIRFLSGNADTSGATWDGTQAITITIPTLTDLVQDPIRFAGTVGSDGAPKTSGGNSFTPAKGDLVYITANCTFAGQVCEAGDMAVYDGAAWRVIQGENQVSIAAPVAQGAAPVYLTGTLQDVLTVEGQTLKLAIDYSDVLAKIKVERNSSATLSVVNGTVTVPSMHVGLHKETDGGMDISKAESIDLPTALASGDVTISDKVLIASDFSWDAGTLPTISKNAAAINVSMSHSMSIGKLNNSDGANGDYVTSVVAIKSVSLADGSASDNSITYVSGLVAAEGKSFVSGIHAWTSADGENAADFEVPGAVSAAAAANTFVSGLSAAAASGDLVSSITVGNVTIGTGSGILTGTSSGELGFVKSVTMGTAELDATAQWFYSGLGSEAASGDVVSSISVGETSLIADNASSFSANAIISASVSNHVLSFSTGSFMQPVKLSRAADSVQYKSFTKSGVKLSGFASVSDTFTTGSLQQAATSVSYKNVLTKAVELTQGSAVKFYLDKDTEHNYTAGVAYKKISTVDADITKNTPKLENTTISAAIPANTVAVDITGGVLPSWSAGTATGTLSGTVGTALTSTSYSWLGIDSTKQSGVVIPGAYSLTSSSADAGVDVGAAGTYNVTGATATIPANEFVINVYVDDSEAGVRNNPQEG